MKQVFNPYLPTYEYIPDGEPHRFGDRIYIYGSHDLFNGKNFCLGDYVCWSCPADDLKSWRYEGVIWRKSDDPFHRRGGAMYAPDVCQGPDGRYYLYYFFSYDGDIGVAVCDTPVGHYTYLGRVHYEDGTLLGKKKGDIFQFDPSVYVEGDDVYLYTGFAPVHYPFFLTGGKPITKHGPVCARLMPDMLTVKSVGYIGVECKTSAKGTPYEGHEFFEASSLRKIGDTYYFIYSTFAGHELAYATSDNPTHGFTYGGVIISNGDVGLRGIEGVRDAANFTGNNHGSLCRDAFGRYYIFYHRQTNRHCFSRQACAEPVTIGADGSIAQVEMTSCGLNGGTLAGKGTYSSAIACNLTCKKGGTFYRVFKGFGRPYLTQTGQDRECDPDQYIAAFKDGSTAGFKYFDLTETKSISLTFRGKANGKATVTDGTKMLCTIPVKGSGTFTVNGRLTGDLSARSALFVTFRGKGAPAFVSFSLA